MSTSTIKYQRSVGKLLCSSIHSGWIKQAIDTTFGKSVKKRYGVIHEGYFYLFKDDQSTSASDVISLSQFKLQEMERFAQPSRWGFSLQGDRYEGKGREIIEFTVGSERELRNWMYNLENWGVIGSNVNQDSYCAAPKVFDAQKYKANRNSNALVPASLEKLKMAVYEVTDERPNEKRALACSVPLSLPTQEENATTNPEYYCDPDAGPSYDNTNDYLPSSVFKWNLDRSAASDLLTKCGTPGVYIMRKGRDKDDVISAYLLNEARHYKIFVENDELFLRKDHPRFRKHIHLIMYYHLNNLPTCHARLEAPYRDQV